MTILLAMAYGNATITARSLKYRTTLASGAPWPTKMGTILSLFPYDDAAYRALQWVNLRRPAVLRHVLAWGGPPFSRRHHHSGNMVGAGLTGGSVPEGPA
jgi:hypothetical protein